MEPAQAVARCLQNSNDSDSCADWSHIVMFCSTTFSKCEKNLTSKSIERAMSRRWGRLAGCLFWAG